MNSQETIDVDRLEQLVNEKCNGSLRPEGYDELNSMLAKSAGLRSAYWEMMAIHVDLHWGIAGEHFSNGEARRRLPSGFDDGSPLMTSHRMQTAHSVSRSWGRPAIAAGMMAVLLSGWSLWRLSKDRLDRPAESIAQSVPTRSVDTRHRPNGHALTEADENTPVTARLVSLAAGSLWYFGRLGDQNPEEFHLGDTVRVEKGAAEIRFDSGAVGTLVAPVTLQLSSGDRVRLLSGRVSINAPEQAHGFTVETPSAEVVDLGTVFSVEVAEAGTDLVVFGGKVDLSIPDKEVTEDSKRVTTMHFTTGEAAHVDRNGAVSRIMSVNSFADPMSPIRIGQSPLIASVSDNSVRDDYWKFYEVIPGGMDEDAPAFVDRFHEWNGATPMGMPLYLVGGDYVKMFNDDKATEDLLIELTLTQPTVLYVLLDNRVSVPEWLAASFSNTGDVIGVDESPHDTANRFPANQDFAQVGPGESIDRTHSIWKRVLPEGGTVVLGPNGQLPEQDSEVTRVRSIRANMYGIVAVPLH